MGASSVDAVAPVLPLSISAQQAPIAASLLQAGEPKTVFLSRDAAIDQALQCNPSILEARQALKQRTGIMWEVRARILPQISAYGQRTSIDHTLIDRSTAELLIPEDARSPVATQSIAYGVELRQLIFDGLSGFNQYVKADCQKEASYWQMVAVGYMTIAQLQQAYDAVLWRESNLRIYAETVEGFKQLADVTAKREKAGQITPLDSLRVQTELSRAIAQHASAQSELAAAQEKLKVLLQLPECDLNFNILQLDGPLEQRLFDMPIQEALYRAGHLHPELYMAQANKQAARAGLDSAIGDYLPKVEAFARYGTRSSYQDYHRELDGWTVGISGQWILFNSFGREGHVMSQKADLMTAEIRLSDQRYRLTSRIYELFAQKKAYEEALKAQKQAVIVGERALNEGQKRYRIGETDIETVIDAQTSYRNVLLELQQRTFEANTVVYQLEYMVSVQPVTQDQVAGR